MSVLTSVGILLLSLLILASLQLVPGVFAYFSHFSQGKFSHSKAADLATFFILGVETSVVIIFISLYAILCCSPAVAFVIDSDIFAWIIAGILLALSLVSITCYYRPDRGSQLFIPRRLVQGINKRIANVQSRSDAFTIGIVSIIPELVFTLPLYLISTIEIMRLDINCLGRTSLIILFALVVIFPLILFRFFNHHQYNLADFLKFRFKNKPFFRICLGLSYLIIAILIILGVLL